MGRIALPSAECLLCAVLGLLTDVPARAGEGEEPTDEEIPVEQIVVTGKREEPVDVRTYTREEIEQRGARVAADVLERDPAVNAESGKRGERIFTIRGFDQRQTAVLVDGVPAYIPYDGQVNLAMIPAALIDHITVVKGPGSIQLGPNGLGGAVNVVTRRPGDGPVLTALLEAGPLNAVNASFAHSLEAGPFGYTLAAGLVERRGFSVAGGAARENSDRELGSLHAALGLDLGKAGRFTATASHVQGSFGVPPSQADLVPVFWRFNDWRATAFQLGHSATWVRGLTTDEVVYLRLFDNLLDAYDNDQYQSQTLPMSFHDWFHDTVVGGRVRARLRTDALPWGATDFRLWASAQHETHAKDASAEDDSAMSRTILTLAPEAEALLGDWLRLLCSAQIDLELPDDFPDLRAENQAAFYPLFSASVSPLVGLELTASVARRGRFPTLKERFSSGIAGVVEPNPSLGPESAWHFGLDARFLLMPTLSLGLSLFDAEVSDLIEQVQLGGGLTQLQNVERARFLGTELQAGLCLGPVRLDLGYAFLYARRPDADPDRLEYRPEHKFTLFAQSRPLRWLELGVGLRFIGPQSFVDPGTRAWGRLSGYLLVDVKATLWIEDTVALSLRGTNLTDTRYQTHFGFPDPGRELFLSFRFEPKPAGEEEHS